MHPARLAALLVWTVTASATEVTLVSGWHHERGVESKSVTTLGLAHCPFPRLGLEASLSVALFEHAGISGWRLGAAYRFTDAWNATALAELQHDQWNDWRIGENRALALLAASPLRPVSIRAGAAWRAPILDPDRYASPFAWRSEMPEWNLAYGAEWRFLDCPGLAASAAVSNLAPTRFYNPQHVAIRLEGSLRLDPAWRLALRLGTAVKGLSAMLLSVNEFTAEVGMSHDF